jgi:hypothetical protein
LETQNALSIGRWTSSVSPVSLFSLVDAHHAFIAFGYLAAQTLRLSIGQPAVAKRRSKHLRSCGRGISDAEIVQGPYEARRNTAVKKSPPFLAGLLIE